MDNGFYYRLFRFADKPTHYVYIVSAEVLADDIRYISEKERLIKIGITNDVPRRLSELHKFANKPLTLHFALGIVDKHHAFMAEQSLLNRYNPNRLMGEWFIGDISTIVNEIAWALELSEYVDASMRFNVDFDDQPIYPKKSQDETYTLIVYAVIAMLIATISMLLTL